MKTTFYFLFVCVLLLNSFPLIAQENEKPFVVSPLIGDTLSVEERNYYNMFSTIENFQWAVFFLNPDSTVRAEVTYLRGGILSDTVVYIDKKVESLRLLINARNDPGSIVQQRDDNYKGSEIIVLQKNGTETPGKLLVVRQGSILLYNEDCSDELIDINCVNKLNSSDIQKVIIPGKSNVGWGVGIGLLLGTAIVVAGIIWTTESEQEYSDISEGYYEMNREVTSGIVSVSLGVAIAAAGTIIGITSSTSDKVIEPFSEDDIKGLSVYSRYPQGEPEELKFFK